MEQSVIVFVIAFVVTARGLITQRFGVENGYKLSGGTVIDTINSKDMSLILCASYCTPPCRSATFSAVEKLCIILEEYVFQTIITWNLDPNWSILFPRVSIFPVYFDDWILVFRAQSGINSSLYGEWTNTGIYNDESELVDFPISCLLLDNVGKCLKHFRSKILDDWSRIDQIRFSMYKEGVEAGYIVFNGVSSSSTSWFARSRVLSSSWTNISSDTGLDYPGTFGLAGYDIRRFYTARATGSCSADICYTMVMDAPSDRYCQTVWNFQRFGYPIFVYSPTPHISLMKDLEFADVLAVFVKFVVG